MQAKRTSKELIAESLIELLETNSLESITVDLITSNCGLSRRTFYNSFSDKYEILERFCTSWAEEHLNDTIEDWVRNMHDRFFAYERFLAKALLSEGQNSMASTITAIQSDKYLCHIDLRVPRNSALMERIVMGIQFMCYGQLGLIKVLNGGRGSQDLMRKPVEDQDPWESMREWIPGIVLQHLQSEPVYTGLHWDLETNTIVHD